MSPALDGTVVDDQTVSDTHSDDPARVGLSEAAPPGGSEARTDSGAEAFGPIPAMPANDPQRTRLVVVAPIVAGGLALQAVGYAIGRAGHVQLALAFFFTGLVTIFAPCAWRLLAERARRPERIQVAVLLGVALVVSYYLLSPLLFTGYDELLHQTTLWQLSGQRALFTSNSLLPVSPSFPGLELLTVSVRWLTGLPVVVCELVTVLVSRVILVLVVFLLVERVTRSSRAGAAGVVVYAASPQFYSFNAAFSYQTLALSLGAGAVYLLVRVAEAPRTGRDYRVWLAAACLWGAVISHHLVGWLTVGLLCVFTIALWCCGRRHSARRVGLVTGFGLVWALAWTALRAPQLYHYLDPILTGAVSGVVGLLTGGQSRGLFRGASGTAAPLWQEIVLLASALTFVVLLAVSVRSVVAHRTVRGGPLRYLPVMVALGYLVVLGSRLSSGSEEVGGRMSTFVFFGMAVLIGAWFASRRPRLRMALVLPIASLCFLGSMILGSGPDWSYVPGPYLPAADQRSVDASTIAAAQWAAQHLPPGSPVAADRDEAALLAAIGHLSPVSEGDGSVNVGPLYFDRTWGTYDIALVRQAHIRYLVVDSRLASGPPAYGSYFEPGETNGVERLHAAQLDKFAAVPGFVKLYTNGPITIYDLSRILGERPLEGTGDVRSPAPTTGANWWVLAPAMAVAGIWVRRRRFPRGADRWLDFLLGAAVAGMAAALVLVPTGLPATPVALVVLAGLGALGLRPPPPWRRAQGDGGAGPGARPSVVRRRWLVASGALTVLLVAGAVVVSVASDATLWRAPTSLSVTSGSAGVPVARAHAADLRGAHLEILDGRTVLWRSGASPVGSDWTVPLPAAAAARGNALVLTEDGRVVREVST